MKIIPKVDGENTSSENTSSVEDNFEACVFGHQEPWKDHSELCDAGGK